MAMSNGYSAAGLAALEELAKTFGEVPDNEIEKALTRHGVRTRKWWANRSIDLPAKTMWRATADAIGARNRPVSEHRILHFCLNDSDRREKGALLRWPIRSDGWWPEFGSDKPALPSTMHARWRDGGWGRERHEVLTIHTTEDVGGSATAVTGTITQDPDDANAALQSYVFRGRAIGEMLFLEFTPDDRDAALGAGVYLLKKADRETYWGVSLLLAKTNTGRIRTDWSPHWVHCQTNQQKRRTGATGLHDSLEYLEQYCCSTALMPENETVITEIRKIVDQKGKIEALDIGGGPSSLYWLSRVDLGGLIVMDVADNDGDSLERARRECRSSSTNDRNWWLHRAMPPAEHRVVVECAKRIRSFIPFDLSFTWPVLGNSYDLVTALFSLECLPSVEEVSFAMREAHRVLRPGGHLLVATVESRYGVWKVGDAVLSCASFTKSLLRQLFIEAGLKVTCEIVRHESPPAVQALTGYEAVLVAHGCKA